MVRGFLGSLGFCFFRSSFGSCFLSLLDDTHIRLLKESAFLLKERGTWGVLIFYAEEGSLVHGCTGVGWTDGRYR